MTDAWKDNHCWVSAPPSLVRDRFLLLATFLQRQIKISANQMKGEWKFFSYLGLLLHLATTSQSHERNSIKKPDFALSLSHNIFLDTRWSMGESRGSCELCNESDFMFFTFLTEESHVPSFCKFRYDFFLFRFILEVRQKWRCFCLYLYLRAKHCLPL